MSSRLCFIRANTVRPYEVVYGCKLFCRGELCSPVVLLILSFDADEACKAVGQNGTEGINVLPCVIFR